MKKNASPILHMAIIVGYWSRESNAAFRIGTSPTAAHNSRCAQAPCLPPTHPRRRTAFKQSFPKNSALYANKARSKKVVDGVEGAVPLALNPAPSIVVVVPAVDNNADLFDVDQEPPKPPPKKRGRKAGTLKSKKNGTSSKADDGGDAADEDVLHWTLESDRATVQYRPIAAPNDVPTAALISELARKRSAARSLKDNAASSALNSTLSASIPVRPVSLVRFVVRGSPRPLVRHRVSTFRMYNPSAKAQKSFQTIIRTLLANATVRENPSHKEGDGNFAESASSQGDIVGVLFPTESLAVSIAFRMRRPLNHFRANRREAGQLRASAPPQTFVTRSDVDNLAKFVLDSFNGLLYDDDRQVCSLHATKILDNDGLCLGSTEVCVRVVGDDDLPTLLDKSFRLF
jgi:Holliday junction resolvase RusA-like endonuclease